MSAAETLLHLLRDAEMWNMSALGLERVETDDEEGLAQACAAIETLDPVPPEMLEAVFSAAGIRDDEPGENAETIACIGADGHVYAAVPMEETDGDAYRWLLYRTEIPPDVDPGAAERIERYVVGHRRPEPVVVSEPESVEPESPPAPFVQTIDPAVGTTLARGFACAAADDLAGWYAAYQRLRAMTFETTAPFDVYAGQTPLYEAWAEYQALVERAASSGRSSGGGRDVGMAGYSGGAGGGWGEREDAAGPGQLTAPALPVDAWERRFILGGYRPGEYRRSSSILATARAAGEAMASLLGVPTCTPFVNELAYDDLSPSLGDACRPDMVRRVSEIAYVALRPRGRRWRVSDRMREVRRAAKGSGS